MSVEIMSTAAQLYKKSQPYLEGYATIFHKIDEKVISSCLLQYKPICVINFDKLCRKMLKRSLVVFLV